MKASKLREFIVRNEGITIRETLRELALARSDFADRKRKLIEMGGEAKFYQQSSQRDTRLFSSKRAFEMWKRVRG